jgi:tRNA (Thr-GGU) A37 N-methylase
VFAARTPSRPSPIGLSLLALKRIEGRLLFVSCVDVLDGTPVLDIKLAVPALERTAGVRLGWPEGSVDQFRSRTADDRFGSDRKQLSSRNMAAYGVVGVWV